MGDIITFFDDMCTQLPHHIKAAITVVVALMVQTTTTHVHHHDGMKWRYNSLLCGDIQHFRQTYFTLPI